MGNIIGIDLGTTFSAMALLDESGIPKIIHNGDGSNVTPSVVSISGETAIVGEEARRLLFTDNVTVNLSLHD
jgi:molecular chaperone DnaK